MDHLWGFSVLCLLCLCARLFICALWSPAGKGLTSWLSFEVSYCEFVTFPLVSWVSCGTWLHRFLIFAPLLTLTMGFVTFLQIYLGYCLTYNTSKREGKDQESIQSSNTPDPGYQRESDNFTIRHHKREPRGQAFPSRRPQGINKQTRTKA